MKTLGCSMNCSGCNSKQMQGIVETPCCKFEPNNQYPAIMQVADKIGAAIGLPMQIKFKQRVNPSRMSLLQNRPMSGDVLDELFPIDPDTGARKIVTEVKIDRMSAVYMGGAVFAGVFLSDIFGEILTGKHSKKRVQ